MNNYFDRFNFLHDKPCINGKASSGNPLIYSALYKCAGGNFREPNTIYYRHMVKHSVAGLSIEIKRHPDKNDIASLDEIIGAIYLDYINDEFLSKYDYRWFDNLYNPGWKRILQAGVYCLGKHRNFFKKDEGNVRDLHPVAYWIPWHIQYYSRKKMGKSGKFLSIFFYMWLFSVLIKKNYKKHEKQTGAISQKNIAWLILNDLNMTFLIKLIKYRRNLFDYFQEDDHPILKCLYNN